MDYFLQRRDFFPVYTEERFDELIEADNLIWQKALSSTIKQISGYLSARYDTEEIFRPLKAFSAALGYSETDRVFWVAVDYSETETYLIGDYVNYQDVIYKCNTEILAGEAFDPAKWDEITENNSIFICIADAPVGTYPDNTTYFTETDDRDPWIVQITVDVCLYHLLNRLNNIDISANRKERYDGNDPNQKGGAIGWLKDVAAGRVNPELPLKEVETDDQTINKIMYGDAEEIKKQNSVF
jgi:phage gp36-like protein